MAAVDIIIVKQDDGSYQSSPFFVRFPTRSKIRRVITVQVNGKKISCPGCELIVDPDHNYAYFSVETPNSVVSSTSTSDSLSSSQYPPSPSGLIIGNNKGVVHVVQSEETQNMIAQYRKKSLPPLPKKGNELSKPPSDLLFEGDSAVISPSSMSPKEEFLSSSPKSLPPLPKKTLPQNLIIKTGGAQRGIEMLAKSPEENEELRREEREMMKEMEDGEDPDDEEKEIFRMVEEETASSRSRSRAVFNRPRAGSNPRKSKTLTPTTSEELEPSYYTSTSPSKVGYMDKWLKSIDQETHPEHRLRPSKEYLDIIHSHMTDGRSSISFIDPNGGLELVKAYVFEFSAQDKIIISDIDGTITKSDIMGQVYSRMGKDYTHPGIAKLFQSIAENNYKFIYLSARPISMAQLTREYINSVYQDGYKMPSGPIITSPNKAFSALAREVVIRRPETFKINCLSSIASLFPTDFPFYCGFGNRPTDCISYVSVNIDPTRCYRINKQGKLLVQATKVTYSSYAEIESQLLKHFPKVVDKHKRSQSDCFRLSGGQLVAMNLPKKKDIDLLREQYMDPEELQT